MDLLECQIANALQTPSAVDVSSPKKGKEDEEKQKWGCTVNVQETWTFLVLKIGKHVCRFILSDGVYVFVINVECNIKFFCFVCKSYFLFKFVSNMNLFTSQ